ncbi:MAG: hydroxymethylglutaryl-CoA lyase [Proteobacteria bacterium]|nr:hydroxymethylglutaryl-CoA lyase [Pseudomonadota bacterium]
MQHVELVEVGPRDGLQNESVSLDLAAKRELIRRLVAAGIRRLEVASFVNPKKVPQMADADELVRSLPKVEGVTYVGLVLNRRGLERAIESGCQEIGMVIVASDTFNRRNQGVSTAESLAAWHEIAAAARQAGVRAQVTLSAAFGCPFEGEVPEARVVELALQAATSAPAEIALADTVGVAVPSQVDSLFRTLRERLPQVPLRGHFHNTRNTGLANAYAALQAGASALDASIGGIGGCPFAPAATGNIPSEDLLYMLERMNVHTGVSLEAMLETSRWIEARLGRSVPGMLVKSGGFPRPAARGSANRGNA